MEARVFLPTRGSGGAQENMLPLADGGVGLPIKSSVISITIRDNKWYNGLAHPTILLELAENAQRETSAY